MFKFTLYNGSLTIRVFVALTVALCFWSILILTGNAMEEDEEVRIVHLQEGTDRAEGDDTAEITECVAENL